MITATVAALDLILFLVFRQNNYHITPSLTLAKFYSNNLLVIFNSRIRILGARDQPGGVGFEGYGGGGYGGDGGESSGNGNGNGGPTPMNYNFLSRDGTNGTSTVISTVSASKASTRAVVGGFKNTFSSHGGRSDHSKSGIEIGHGPNDFPLGGITVDVTTQRDTDEESLPTQGEGGVSRSFLNM